MDFYSLYNKVVKAAVSNKLDDELKELLDAPADTPAFRQI
jgi:hypothetical protein